MARPKKIVEESKATTAKKAVKKTTTSKTKTTAVKKTSAKKVPPKKEVTLPKTAMQAVLDKVSGKKEPEIEEYAFDIKDVEFNPENFVVILTPDRNIYEEPVPRYCDFDSFKYMLTVLPDMPTTQGYSMRADIVNVKYGSSYEMFYNIFDGTRRTRNKYAPKFGVNLTIGGNLVFTGKGKPLDKKGADKLAKEIFKTLQEEEVIDMTEPSENKEEKKVV